MSLDRLVIGNSTVNIDVIEACTKFGVDLSSSAMTEITLEFSDPEFRLLATGLFSRQIPLRWDDLSCEIAVVETGSSPAPSGLSVRARSKAVQTFRRNKIPVVRNGLSPTTFLMQEAAAAGATVVAQSSPVRDQIARVTTEDKQESTWDVMTTLASELGYLFFESAGVFYFGQPTWLVTRDSAKWAVKYNMAPKNETTDQIIVLDTPVCRQSENSKNGAEIELIVNRATGTSMRPGDLVNFSGVPQFAGRYMVTNVSWDELSPIEPVSVTITTPINPTPSDSNTPDPTEEGDTLADPFSLVDESALEYWVRVGGLPSSP